jgi:spore maturation protein B
MLSLTNLSNLLFLLIIVGIPLWGMLRRLDIWGLFIQGAQDAFPVALKIIPPLVAMYVALGMFRAAQGFELIQKLGGEFLAKLGFPNELVPLALIRPFSGSSALAMLGDIAQQHGGDSFIAHAAAVLVGSTETTFYLIAVYLGVIAIRKTRYAISVGLLADFAGIIAAIVVANYFW